LSEVYRIVAAEARRFSGRRIRTLRSGTSVSFRVERWQRCRY
jgi:hypothetical protein